MASEFRKDLVSGDWVLFSTERVYSIKHLENIYQALQDCPFENLEQSNNDILWKYPDNADWQVAVIKNSHPAVKSGLCAPDRQFESFSLHDAIGEHDVFVFRNHEDHFADLHIEKVVNIIAAYKKRYKELTTINECTRSIMIFHNSGSQAGASVYHPHSQVLSLPVLSRGADRNLHGAHAFYKKTGKCVYDFLLSWELVKQSRIVYENEFFVALCPFVSKFPYEVRIFPRNCSAHFEQLPDAHNLLLADVLGVVLKKVKKVLDNPAYNFYIHTAPVEAVLPEIDSFYSWHVEILPKVQVISGFEMGTGININVVDPDEAAKLLREAN